MKVQNKKTEVSPGVELNDRDYMFNLLSALKEYTKNYATMMTEASNDNLYNIYLDSFADIAQLQREVYEAMFQNGWYTLEAVDSNKITTKLDTLTKELTDLYNEN